MNWSPLLIAVAPNGARKSRKDHAAIPLMAVELARDARACLDAGAAMLHLHVRDKDGAHTLDAGIYRETIDTVRGAVGDDMIIQVTTEAVGRYTPDQQIAMLRDVYPRAASVALREIAAIGEEKAADFYRWALDAGIAVQHILYTPAEIGQLAGMARRHGMPRESLSVLYVLGRYGNGESQPFDLLPFLDAARDHELRPGTWSVCAFGSREGAVALMAMSLGGHVRVGFENNLYLNNGTLAPDNAALVGQVAEGARLIARPLCHAREAWALMGMAGENHRTGSARTEPGNVSTRKCIGAP